MTFGIPGRPWEFAIWEMSEYSPEEDADVSDDLPGEPKGAKQVAQGVLDRLHAGRTAR